MAADLLKAIQALPAGVDPYDFLLDQFGTQVFPAMTDAFWLQAHIATGLLGVSILVTLTALAIKARKGRLHWFIEDGAATRPSPRVFTPVLFSVVAVFLIIFSILFERGVKDRKLTAGLGSFWWYVASVLTISYAIISTSVICNAPSVRRALINYNRRRSTSQARALLPSATLLNTLLVLACLAFLAGVAPGSYFAGRQFATGQQGYEQAVATINAARQAQDMTLLAGLADAMATLQEAKKWSKLSARAGGLVYSSYTIIFFVTGIIPALGLNRTIKARISKLEVGQTSSTGYSGNDLDPSAHLSIHIPLQPASPSSQPDTPSTGHSRLSFKPELPKERPFANLAAQPTTAMPQAYHNILTNFDTSGEKALQLRKALQRDNTLLAAYFVLLTAMTSLAFYQASGVTATMTPKTDFTISYCWEVYSFLVPYLFLSGVSLHDALYGGSDEHSVNEAAAGLAFGNRGDTLGRNGEHPIAAIQLSQTVVEVVEEGQYEEKKRDYRYE